MTIHACYGEPAEDDTIVFLVRKSMWEKGLRGLTKSEETQLSNMGFSAASGEIARLIDEDGETRRILFGLGASEDLMQVAGLSSQLNGGKYAIAGDLSVRDLETVALAWSDGAYRFDRYKARTGDVPVMVIPNPQARERLSASATAIDQLRNLVNTPAEDMGPSQIDMIISVLGETYGAEVKTVVGEDLLEENYPLVHAVGRAAEDEPRIIELTWGEEDAPLLAIVGKGVAFDTGGLNIKTGPYMRIMKKDMAGSAHAIALARMVMAHNLPVRLKLLVPAVENGINGGAFRPGDIYPSRKGLTVEIENTDAEGRLVLADALTRAQEDGDPDLLIDFATLTGAARVALGPELAPFYTNDGDIAGAMKANAADVYDPVWEMPLWQGYERDLKSPIADLKNLGDGPMGGSITAALFLKNFVDTKPWIHFDVWSWRKSKYGQPEGAAAQGLRATFAMLEERYR